MALPTTRLAVMGTAGIGYVYKDELRAIHGAMAGRLAAAEQQQRDAGLSKSEAGAAARDMVDAWVKAEEAELSQRYERELMNPNEALSLGSISQIVMPSDLRQVLAENMEFHLRHYQPEPMAGIQREFH